MDFQILLLVIFSIMDGKSGVVSTTHPSQSQLIGARIMSSHSTRKVLWKKRAQQWIEDQQGKHFCQCGCGKVISITINHYFRGIGRFLRGHSPGTAASRSKPRNTEDDFWKKVVKTDGCWEWIGWKRKDDGRGIMSWNNKRQLAYRLSFLFIRGHWPSKFACHSCDNPNCVNPDHIFEGDQAANMLDAAKKGRMKTKYSPEEILAVVALVRSGVSRKDAAEKFGMSAILACKIMDGSVWSHLTGIPKKKTVRYG